MRASKVGYQKWAMAIYLMTTNLKGWLNGRTFFSGPVEADERYASEFSGRHNSRPLDTESRMRASTRGMEGKRLRYADLIADEPRLL